MACYALAALLLMPAVLATTASAQARAQKRSAPVASPNVQAATDGVLDLFRKKSVVAISDDHGLAQEEVFYSALMRDPRFADEVGNVVVEFGGEASQDIVDRYVNGDDVPLAELRRVWTDTVGMIPGPTPLGYVNFYATVRAVNLKLPPERRIKVWLGDPKVDWSQIHSLRDLAPYLASRDDNFARIINDEILGKQKKALLIIGSGHLVAPDGPGPLREKIDAKYPGSLAIVWPFTGYLEPQCNAKVVARASRWPVPAIASPVQGTWLQAQLKLPGCNYMPVEQLAVMKDMAPAPGTRGLRSDKLPPPDDVNQMQWNLLSGATADAILYLGPPDSLTESLIDPDIYLDLAYFKEEARRLRCCSFGGGTLDWDQLVQENFVPKKAGSQPQLIFFGSKPADPAGKKKMNIPLGPPPVGKNKKNMSIPQ